MNLDILLPGWSNGKKFLLVSTECTDPIYTQNADTIGTLVDIQSWLRCVPSTHKVNTFYVADTPLQVLECQTMFPTLDIRHADEFNPASNYYKHYNLKSATKLATRINDRVYYIDLKT